MLILMMIIFKIKYIQREKMTTRQIRYFLLSITVALFTACGSSSNGDSTQQDAIDTMAAYAENGTPVPTVQDYIDAGVTGVNAENIDAINAALVGLTPADIDTTEEIQEITDGLDVNILPTVSAGADKNGVIGSSITVSGSASDIDGTIASYAWSKDGNTLASTASFDYALTEVGINTLTLTVMDNDGGTASDNMNIEVVEVPNEKPVANIYSAQTEYETAHAFTLTGSDGDNDPLTFLIVTDPSNGTLSGTIPNLTYTPNSKYVGLETFTFKVNDTKEDSAPATVSIRVNAPVPNTKPVANPYTGEANTGTPHDFTLTGSDGDDDPLTFSIVTAPSNGEISGTAPNITYTSYPSYVGEEVFTFKANDGIEDSDVSNITFNVSYTGTCSQVTNIRLCANIDRCTWRDEVCQPAGHETACNDYQTKATCDGVTELNCQWFAPGSQCLPGF